MFVKRGTPRFTPRFPLDDRPSVADVATDALEWREGARVSRVGIGRADDGQPTRALTPDRLAVLTAGLAVPLEEGRAVPADLERDASQLSS